MIFFSPLLYCFIIIVIDCKLMFHDRENITLFYCLVTNFVGVAEPRSLCGMEAAGAAKQQQRAELEEGINELWERRTTKSFN